MAKKYCYLFSEGNANMRELLGGKGANLAEMTNIGLPVPQGFTITTEACTQYYEDGRKINDEIMEQIMEAIVKMEEITGKKFGDIWGDEVDGLLTKDDFDANGKLLIDQSKIHANWYPGDIKYKDLDGDGKITPGNSTADEPGDRRIIGNSTPRFRYGINLALGYEFEKAGRLDLSMFFQGVAKRDVFMSGSFFFFGTGGSDSGSSAVSISVI